MINPNSNINDQIDLPQATPLPMGKNLLVNYVSLLGGTVIAKAFGLLTVLMLTRYLGVEGFGQFSLVFSYWALLNTLVDFGSAQILNREIARDPAHPRPAIETAIYLRLLGCLVLLPLAYLAAPLIDIPRELALVASLGVLAAFEVFYDVYFSATMQLHQNAKARYFASLMNVILIAMGVLLGWPLLVIMLIALLNPLVKLAYDVRFGGRFRLGLNPPDWPRLGRMARDGWPLWLAGIQYIILARIDTFMLQTLAPNGSHELGIYAAAFRFTEVLALLINALSPTLLPLLVSGMHDSKKIGFLASTGTRMILAVVIPLSLLIFWYVPWIVNIYGPEYQAAGRSMQILIWSQVLVAVNSICYILLMVYNVQGRRPIILFGLLVTLLNIALNAWLIPVWQAEGASWATVLTELAAMIGTLWFLRRLTPVRLEMDVLAISGLGLACCLVVLPLGALFGGWLSAVLFAGLVFLFRLLTPEALKTLAREKLHAGRPTPSPGDMPDPEKE